MNNISKFLLSFIFFLFSASLHAQTTNLEVDIEDAFLKVPLTGVKVSVLNPDHSVVVDSATCLFIKNTSGKLIKVIYIAPVKAEKRDYLIRATKPGYGDVTKSVAVPSSKVGSVNVPTIKMRKELNVNLNEAVVKATKIKMYYKGDTLVYNADAFKLPDGSMLDGLIKQLPGVTMDDAGAIYVNGRRVDELLLGSRSFFKGNKKVLMENLPYYTVKDLKVYEKQTDKSQALGYDIEPRSFVMDVNLKNEYSQGYVANVEAAYGTEKRWLGRGFLLGFNDRWRYALLANSNNVNESRHIGERGSWSPATMPQSLLTTHSVATDLDYQSKDKKVKNNFNADLTSSRTESEMRQRYEQFLDGSKPVSLTQSRDKSDNLHLKLSNNFTSTRSGYFNLNTNFNYDKNDGSGSSQFDQLNDSLTASMRTKALSEGRGLEFLQTAGGVFNINKKRKWHGNYGLYFTHRDNQSWLSNRFNTWQEITQTNDIRHNASDVSKKTTNLLLNSFLTFSNLLGKVDLVIGEEWQYFNDRTHDYLYHPDTLLLASKLDMLTAITDPSNSYNSHHHGWTNTASISFSQKGSYRIGNNPIKITYDRWNIGFKVPVYRRSLDYKRGAIDTLMCNTWVYFNPTASFRHMSTGARRDFRITVDYKSTPQEMLDMIDYRDDSQPLVVKRGNPNLKGRASTTLNINYRENGGKVISQWHVGGLFNYIHRDVAQSVMYNPTSGVYTYRPMNISGAYFATASFDMSSSIGKSRYWTWQMNGDASYNHSLDYSMLYGETQSHENAVNTTILHDAAYIQYNRDVFNVRVFGDVSWRQSKGKMRDFKELNALDFNYGLSARYTIPRINTTLSADATMYSRRGYGSSTLNTDDFILNASISQPFCKGKLISKIEIFDLLNQISSTQYEVNAQGRLERWFKSLPHYIMLHLVYHWNRNPKKL